MEMMVFLSGEITVVRHLVDANPMYIPFETKAPLKRHLVNYLKMIIITQKISIKHYL